MLPPRKRHGVNSYAVSILSNSAYTIKSAMFTKFHFLDHNFCSFLSVGKYDDVILYFVPWNFMTRLCRDYRIDIIKLKQKRILTCFG